MSSQSRRLSQRRHSFIRPEHLRRLLRSQLDRDNTDASGRRIEAIEAILRGEEIGSVANNARVSTRTIRRWTARARTGDVRWLASSDKTLLGRLSQETRQRLRRDLALSPRKFGIAQGRWGGAALAHHLNSRYGLRLSTRHCRRVLRKFGLSNNGPPRAAAAATPSPAKPRPVLLPRSDLQTKGEALKRIQRLASSGLPKQAFIITLLDLIEDAIPSGPNQAFLSGPNHSMATPQLVARGFDPIAVMPAMKRYGPDSGPEISGTIRPPGPLSPSHPVARHEEVALPHFYRSAGYNEVFRPNHQHHLLSLGWFGNTFGDFRCTLWRGEQMKPFSDDDARFAAAIAPHIRHGLTVAETIQPSPVATGDFVALRNLAPGLVYLAPDGKVRAMDARAEEMFRLLGAFDAIGANAFDRRGRARIMEAVTHHLRDIFHWRGDTAASAAPPGETLYCSQRGLAAKLSGFVLSDAGGSAGFGVMVELGEPRELLRRRLQYRFGLSPRQAQIVELLARATSARECARTLQMSPGTLRSHLRDLISRLQLPGIEALRKFAQEHSSPTAAS